MTWSIAGSGEDISRFGYSTERSVSGDSFLDYNYSKVIAEAFAEWSKYGDIEFKQVADQGGAAGVGKTADIRIFFGAIPGGTVGYAYFPSKWGSAIAGDILMDTISLFNKDPGWFKAVMLHEIGHALGLDHVSSNSIMTPTIKKIGLQPDDIAGIQKIYGVQQDAPSEPDPEPAPQPKPKPQPEPEEPAAGTQPDPEPAPAPKPNTGDDERLVGDGGKDRIKGGDGDDTFLAKAAMTRSMAAMTMTVSKAEAATTTSRVSRATITSRAKAGKMSLSVTRVATSSMVVTALTG